MRKIRATMQGEGIALMDSAHPKYRPDIDGLRAIAVMAVVLYHIFPVQWGGGFIGVDVFFVISGFLISHILFSKLNQSNFSFATFYTQRIKRIFPALLVILLVSFTFGWFFLLAAEYKQLGKHIAAGAAFVSNFVLWQEAGYFDNDANSKPLLHLWSLGIEEQFYIFWPMLLWLMHRLRLNFLLVTCIIFIASFTPGMGMMSSDAVGAFYSPFSRFWELMMGGCLAYFVLQGGHEKQQPLLSNLIAAFGLSFIALAIVLINKDTPFPGFWALFPTIGAFCILSAGPHSWLNRVILGHPLLVGIGLISYPLYLWHWPILVFAKMIQGEPLSVTANYALILLSTFLAWLTYRFIERPIRFGKPSALKTAVLCGLMIGMAGLGLYAYEQGGFAFRYPAIIQQFTQIPASSKEDWRDDKCFLNPQQNPSDFVPECSEQHHRPLIFLWGDSHAAALYQGLKNAQAKRSFGIAQYTASACPPLLHYDKFQRAGCRGINDVIFEDIRKTKPDIVLLHADWTAGYDLSKLEATVAELRKTGAKRIVLLGSVPHWHDTLAHDIFVYWRKSQENPPLYMQYGQEEEVADRDREMAARAQNLHIEYISAYRALCNPHGCMTRTAENSTSIISFDNAHFTPQGAALLIDRIGNQLFADTKFKSR